MGNRIKLGGDWQTCGFVILLIVGITGAVGVLAVWQIAEAIS